MPYLLDLPLEIRRKIFSEYGLPKGPYWRIITEHPNISLVNRQLRSEYLSYLYSRYRWAFCISISADGSMAVMEKGTLEYLQRMQQAGQLWRVQKVRIIYAFPAIQDFGSMSNHFDAQYPTRSCFFDTFCGILRQAPSLRHIKFFGVTLSHQKQHLFISQAGLRPLALLPKSCEYQVTLATGVAADKGPMFMFADCVEKATGKPVANNISNGTTLARGFLGSLESSQVVRDGFSVEPGSASSY